MKVKNLRKKIIVWLGSAALLLGNFCLAEAAEASGAQFRTVRVYKSSRYNRTRRAMSNRAAVRKAQQKAKAKRKRARRR